jgi:glycosyltransferase involved in cell wall biosynthesis
MAKDDSPRLRLFFVTSGLERGGAEGFLVRLVLRLAERGHACGVAVLSPHALLAAPLLEAGIDVARVGNGVLAPMIRLSGAVRRFHPDVVQGWMYRGNLAALFAARAAAKRPALVWSVRQGLNDIDSSPWLTRLSVSANAWLSRAPFAVVYNAESAKGQHETIGFRSTRSLVIPNGIDVASAPPDAGARVAARAAYGLADSTFAVAMLARWHPVKNHHGFVRAAGAFARRRPEARFLLAGAGVDARNATLVSWLRAEGIAERVSLLGELADVAPLLAAADVTTLSSHGEAFPNALLEAMAAGCPCVAPDVGDIAALIDGTGVIVAAGDTSALAGGWEALAAMTSDDRRALGEKARTRAAAVFGLDRAVSAFESLYVEAAGQAPGNN